MATLAPAVEEFKEKKKLRCSLGVGEIEMSKPWSKFPIIN